MVEKETQLEYNGLEENAANKLPYLRKRAYVNMGSTSSVDGSMPRALLQMGQEVLSNSVDESLSGFGNEITTTIHADNSMTVSDHGRGFPRDSVTKDENGKEVVVPFGSVVMGITRAGTSGKFNNDAYEAGTGGLNGIGLKATNAISEYMIVEAQTSQKQHYEVRIDYDKFIENEEPTYTKELPFDESKGTYTNVTFLPDKRVLASIDWKFPEVADRDEMTSYLTPKTRLILIDERNIDEETGKPMRKEWYSENGLADYLKVMCEGSKTILDEDKPIKFNGAYEVETGNPKSAIKVDGVLTWVDNIGLNAESFANGIPTKEGGPHLDGALQVIVKAINEYADNRKLLNKNSMLEASDIKDGLTIAIAVKIPEKYLQFEGQTKEKLGTGEAKTAAKSIVSAAVEKWLYDHEEQAEELVEKMKESKSVREQALQARKDAQEARKQKSEAKQQLMVSPKLIRASSKDPADRELFLVEGDSAGGSIKGARNLNQAIFPLKGKVFNVLNASLQKCLKNQEISTIASVLGAGVGPEFNPDDLEYDKIIILTDADDDGMHIRSLLTLLFYKLFPQLIEQGHLYIAEAPLFKVRRYEKGQQISEYAFDVQTKNDIIQKWHAQGYRDIEVSRFKGLGENAADELRDTVVLPGKRRLMRVDNLDDKATQACFDLIMGKPSPEKQSWFLHHINIEDEDTELEEE